MTLGFMMKKEAESLGFEVRVVLDRSDGNMDEELELKNVHIRAGVASIDCKRGLKGSTVSVLFIIVVVCVVFSIFYDFGLRWGEEVESPFSASALRARGTERRGTLLGPSKTVNGAENIGDGEGGRKRENKAVFTAGEDAEGILTDKEAVKPFVHLDGMKHVPDDALIKRELRSDKFLMRDEDVIYLSEAAMTYAEACRAAGEENIYFKKGVLWGVVGKSKVGVQNADLKDGIEVFRRYMSEILVSAQSAHMFLTKNSRRKGVGFALIVDYGFDELRPEQLELFDYVISNRIPREVAKYMPNGIGWGGKVSSMLFTPFEKTLYVDGDTHFCADLYPEFTALDYANIAFAPDYRASQRLQGSLRLNFNAGVILYRKSSIVATLMYDVIQSIFITRKGDQAAWANRLMEFSRFGNLRISILTPRYHFQPCRETKQNCVVTGEVILLHGRCWKPRRKNRSLPDEKDSTAKFCRHINNYAGTRFVATNCKATHVYRIEHNPANLETSLVEVEPSSHTISGPDWV